MGRRGARGAAGGAPAPPLWWRRHAHRSHRQAGEKAALPFALCYVRAKQKCAQQCSHSKLVNLLHQIESDQNNMVSKASVCTQEWLFATAARLAADLGPAMAPLQPAVVAAELSHAYAIQVCYLCAGLTSSDIKCCFELRIGGLQWSRSKCYLTTRRATRREGRSGWQTAGLALSAAGFWMHISDMSTEPLMRLEASIVLHRSSSLRVQSGRAPSRCCGSTCCRGCWQRAAGRAPPCGRTLRRRRRRSSGSWRRRAARWRTPRRRRKTRTCCPGWPPRRAASQSSLR